jgi:hypothetical protein
MVILEIPSVFNTAVYEFLILEVVIMVPGDINMK